ncbi:dihydroxyacetone kinase subunit L [Cryobacterium sp. M23]|uniref:dihydroxyacetone kinase subunit L n=1 Tax=Cryobacterium sp. M23 TaxID=2048292 RepID=UPI000CE43941|nr:dihydroxyacetone kinase subunit L [Cryobacterium sp. M23]
MTRSALFDTEFVAMLRAATEGIKARGKSDLGDKTLLDALVPATDTLEAEVAAGRDPETQLARMSLVARASADATSMLQARRGRASYTGERSIGSPDPGARSSSCRTCTRGSPPRTSTRVDGRGHPWRTGPTPREADHRE